MKKKVWKYLIQAGKSAKATKSDCDKRTYYVGCIAIRDDGAIVHSRNGSSYIPTPYAHAEARVSTRIDHSATVFVARVKGSGEFCMAKPCSNWVRFLRSKMVKIVYFTTGPTNWDFIVP